MKNEPCIIILSTLTIIAIVLLLIVVVSIRNIKKPWRKIKDINLVATRSIEYGEREEKHPGFIRTYHIFKYNNLTFSTSYIPRYRFFKIISFVTAKLEQLNCSKKDLDFLVEKLLLLANTCDFDDKLNISYFNNLLELASQTNNLNLLINYIKYGVREKGE